MNSPFFSPSAHVEVLSILPSLFNLRASAFSKELLHSYDPGLHTPLYPALFTKQEVSHMHSIWYIMLFNGCRMLH